MAITVVPGITVDLDGKRIINKEYRGVRLFHRLGNVSQDYAEQRLLNEIERIDAELECKAHTRPLFHQCATRYLDRSRHRRSIDTISWHVRMLITHIGHLDPHKIHDGTLEPFVKARLAAGAAPTTINRSLEIVRAILNRAARAYRDDDGRPWLETMPPAITMLPESRRSPYPITWEEQDRIFQRLPKHLATMVLFAVNTGLRDSNVCALQWLWETPVPEIGRSVFVIPPEAFKSRRPHVIILNNIAWSIVQSQRGQHPYLGVPLSRKTDRHHEQHRVAERSPRGRADSRAHTRSPTHVRESLARCRRSRGRPRRPPRPRVAVHAGFLCEPRNQPTHPACESAHGAHSHGNRCAGGKRMISRSRPCG
jgi:integrase